MVERIRDLIERFPENEMLVHELMQSDAAFDALCEEYRESAEELSRLELVSGSAAGSEANWLKRRRCSLEEEILTMIEGYRPV